jgi:hypothetical protein
VASHQKDREAGPTTKFAPGTFRHPFPQRAGRVAAMWSETKDETNIAQLFNSAIFVTRHMQTTEEPA